MKNTHPANTEPSPDCLHPVGSAPVWTPNGFLVTANGTEYTVQRENFYGAQRVSGGWCYYLLRREKGQLAMEEVLNTQRTRESSVRRIAERLAANEPNAETQTRAGGHSNG